MFMASKSAINYFNKLSYFNKCTKEYEYKGLYFRCKFTGHPVAMYTLLC